jgi:adenylate kinase
MRRLILPALAATWLSCFAWAQTSKPLVVVLIGPPVSGKTTQADYLRKYRGLSIIAADDLRKAAGAKASDPAAVDNLLLDRMRKADLTKGFVLDGYPATRAQADFLDKVVKELNLPSPLIVQLDVPDEVVRQRAKKRGAARDKPEMVDQALSTYHQELDLARSYYPKADIWTINGQREPSEVWATIKTLLADRE